MGEWVKVRQHCKALWVASGYKKALYKCSPFTIYRHLIQGSSEVGLCDVLRAGGSGRLRRVLQPKGQAHQPGRVVLQHVPGDGHGAHGAGRGGRPAGHEDTAGVHAKGQAMKHLTF